MNSAIFKKEWVKQVIASLSIVCLFISFNMPSSLYADQDMCEEQRNNVAIALAGLTVVGLAAGIGCLAFSSGHHGCQSGSSSCSYSGSSFFSSYSNYSDYSDYSHRVSSHFPSSYYSRLSEYSESESIEIFRTKNALSGIFHLNANTNFLAQEKITPFIQFPDGTIRELESFSSIDSSPSFGPFNQKGTYILGIHFNSQMAFPDESEVGSVTINVNESTIQKIEFNSHSPQIFFDLL